MLKEENEKKCKMCKRHTSAAVSTWKEKTERDACIFFRKASDHKRKPKENQQKKENKGPFSMMLLFIENENKNNRTRKSQNQVFHMQKA
ncbi:MAG: hypothetical protein IJU56_05055 [Clostridia bacterium]|nr:hypothetical protein [Clostridia bacterium]